MFGFKLWFGIIATVPVILCSLLLYPRFKENKTVLILRPLFYVLLCFTVYSVSSLLYMLGFFIGINPDDLSILSVFIMAALCFIQRRFIPSPENLGLFVLPYAAFSVINLVYWIRCAILFGINDSLGWMSYVFDAIPFGAAFSGLLADQSTGWIHALSSFMPLAAAFVGAGTADNYSEKRDQKNNANSLESDNKQP